MNRKNKIVQKLIILFVASFLGLLILELAIFKIAPQKTLYYDQINTAPMKNLYQYGYDRPVEIKPDLRLENITDLYKEYDMTIITDKFGFRREMTDPKKSTVVILGDSMTFGFTVSNNEDFPNILDSEYPECQVINAGKPGAGLNHYVYYLKNILEGKNLKNIGQVIIALNMPGNDWYEMPGLPEKIDPELAQFLFTHERYRKSEQSLPGKIKNLLAYSQTYMFLRQTVAPKIKHAILDQVNTMDSEQEEYNEIGPPVEELIATMISTAKEKDTDIVFLFLPERSFYFKKPPLYTAKLQNFMRENDVQFLDLLPAMKATYTQISDFWQPIEGHYNKGGHEIIAKEIKESGIVKCE